MSDHLGPRLWLNPPSTTVRPGSNNLARRSRRENAGRRQATPLPGMRLYGLTCPVSVTFTVRTSAEIWIEVSNHEGRFFVNHDASVYDLIRQIQQGGHWIEDNPVRAKRKSARRTSS